LAAQLVDGALGMAYGLTSTTLLLSAGVAPAVASASVHLAEVGTTLVSGVAHSKLGNTDWRAVRWLALPGGVGAFFGAVALSSMSADAAKPWIAIFLVVLGGYVLVRFALLGGRAPARAAVVRRRLLIPLGLGAGFLDAAGGGGWGPISTPTLLAAAKMEPRRAIGTVATSEFVVAVCASIGFLLALQRGTVALPVVAALLLGGAVAAPIAALLVRLMHPRVLGASVGGLIVFTNGRTLLQNVGLDAGLRLVASLAIAAIWAFAIVVAIRAVRAERGPTLAALPK
jgi:uncharacterized membrane protein YfcA